MLNELARLLFYVRHIEMPVLFNLPFEGVYAALLVPGYASLRPYDRASRTSRSSARPVHCLEHLEPEGPSTLPDRNFVRALGRSMRTTRVDSGKTGYEQRGQRDQVGRGEWHFKRHNAMLSGANQHL